MESFREIGGGDGSWLYEVWPGEYIVSGPLNTRVVSASEVIDAMARVINRLGG